RDRARGGGYGDSLRSKSRAVFRHQGWTRRQLDQHHSSPGSLWNLTATGHGWPLRMPPTDITPFGRRESLAGRTSQSCCTPEESMNSEGRLEWGEFVAAACALKQGLVELFARFVRESWRHSAHEASLLDVKWLCRSEEISVIWR